MCIGLPMRIVSHADAPAGHAWAEGRGERRLLDLALVGECTAGDWVLVFLEGARERLSPERAAEIDATLDLVATALHGHDPWTAGADLSPAAFELPSAMSAAQLADLVNPTSAPNTSSTTP